MSRKKEAYKRYLEEHGELEGFYKMRLLKRIKGITSICVTRNLCNGPFDLASRPDDQELLLVQQEGDLHDSSRASAGPSLNESNTRSAVDP